MNKICVYAMCKNEAKFVERWLQSMSEADYIVVLDTGSEDETYELLKNDKRVYKAEQKIISPWRFDVARNESMKLIPEDANILICTDLDETLDAGWADVIRENWIDGFHVQGWYKYAWSHNESGDPGRIFYYNKLHDRNWKWKAPVHEYLASDVYDENYINSHCIDLFDKVYLHHYPDNTKSRGSYLSLLELRVQEDETDYYGKYYLSHEYYYRGQYENSIKTLNEMLNDEKYLNTLTQLEIAACYLYMGDCYHEMGKSYEAISSYNKAIEIDSTYREPYIAAAELYNELSMYYIAIGYVEEGIKKSFRHFNWLERDNSWEDKPYDILAIAYFYIDKKELSYTYAEKALELNPTDERLIFNRDIIKDAL